MSSSNQVVSQNFPSKPKVVTPATDRASFPQEAQDNNRVQIDTKQGDRAGDSFWQFTSDTIDARRWNQQFPYQLLVLDYDQDSDQYSFSSNGWSFTLPIPPESLSLDMPFAITTAVTLGGISEEHNAAPLRTLMFTGTTGVLPNKESAAKVGGRALDSEFVDAILAGSTPSFDSGVAFAVDTQITTGAPFMNLASSEELANSDKGRGTGYFQFRLLQQFLELYAHNKKNGLDGWQNKRLAVAMWKDQSVYVVSPINFRFRRDKEDPLAYHYELSFKAWRRVRLSDHTGLDRPLSDFLRENEQPGYLRQGLNSILAARSILSKAYSALEAIQGNVTALVFEPLRQLTALYKDLLGVSLSIADMPASIVSEAKGALMGSNLAEDVSEAKQRAKANSKSMEQDMQAIAVSSTLGQTAHSAQSFVEKTAEEINKVFSNPIVSNDALATVSLSQLSLPLSTKRKVQDDIDKIRRLSRDDFTEMRNNLQDVAAHYADSVGAGSGVYDATFQRNGSDVNKTPSDDDFEVLFAFNESVMQLDGLIAQQKIDTTRIDAINYVAGLARRAGIAFTSPVSKFPVPFPYGTTLEQLSLQYLGDPNRWHEIAALNGLRSPYVDEEGTSVPLLTNGRLNQVTVADGTVYWVGQLVTLTASNTVSAQRRITKIDKVHDSMTILHLDGAPDLDRFIVMADAKIHGFLPDTVNSRMSIYIPSQSTVEQGLTTISIPGVDAFDPFLAVGGADFLLDGKNDIVISPSGAPKWAYGLHNLVQRVKVAVATVRGSLPQHPSFGIGLKAGVSTADIDAKQIAESLEGVFRNDPAFSGVVKVTVEKKGSTASVRLSLAVANSSVVLPISFEVG